MGQRTSKVTNICGSVELRAELIVVRTVNVVRQ